MKLEALVCPNCGAPLPQNTGHETLRCEYCGSAVLLEPAEESAFDSRLPDPSLSEVAALLGADRRVQATIRYREITGAGLNEAKVAIDAYLTGQPLRRPNRMGG